MKRQKASATDVEKLAVKCAREMANKIKTEIVATNYTLPLSDSDLNHLLDETIQYLQQKGQIPWYGISMDRRQVFIESWAREMTRQGVRA